MNIITKKFVGSAIALVALAFPVAPAFAADLDWGGDWVTDSVTSYYDYGYDSYDSGGSWVTDSVTPYYDSYGYDTSGTWVTDSVTPYYDYGYDSYSGGYSAPSFSGGGSSYSYPSFGGSSPIYTSAANQQYRQQIAPSMPTFVQPNVANACTAVNSCNTDNSYTDNSVYAPDNSYTYTNTVTDNSVYSAPVTTTVTAPTTISYGPVTTSHDSHNQQISYPAPQYQAPTFNPPVYHQPQYQSQYQYQAQYQQPPVYQQPQRPVSYNTTPYVTLSSLPYTGLDLGPMGEVLYWTFLVLWCLAAAYLIAVKRVQNKVVSFLNGFLFGSRASVATAAPAPRAMAAASAPLVEEGIDPFIASQIKR